MAAATILSGIESKHTMRQLLIYKYTKVSTAGHVIRADTLEFDVLNIWPENNRGKIYLTVPSSS